MNVARAADADELNSKKIDVQNIPGAPIAHYTIPSSSRNPHAQRNSPSRTINWAWDGCGSARRHLPAIHTPDMLLVSAPAALQ